MILTKKVQIECYSCRSLGFIQDTEYGTGRRIKLLCPGCNGSGYVVDDEIVEDEE